MRSIFLGLFMTLMFVGCGTAIKTNVEVSNEIVIKKTENKTVYIDYINQTDEDVRLTSKLARALKAKGYLPVRSIEQSKYHLVVDLIFANSIEKRSTTKNVLSNVNLGVKLGSQIFKNVGISGSIGTTVGSILGNSMDEDSFQMVVDISLEEFLDESKTDMKINDSQIVAEAIVNGNPQQKVIDALEDEIVRIISEFFDNK